MRQVTIDCFDFARNSSIIHGRMAALQLGRLADHPLVRDCALSYSVSGIARKLQGYGLRVEVKGTVTLICQRCLNPFDFDLQRQVEFKLVTDEAAIPVDADTDLEYLVAETQLDICHLIEDEVLLSLPLAPQHLGGTCTAAFVLEKQTDELVFGKLQHWKDKHK